MGSIIVRTGTIIAKPPGRISDLRPPPSSVCQETPFYIKQNAKANKNNNNPTSIHYKIKLDIIPLLNQILHDKQKVEAQADESRGDSCCRHAGASTFVISAIIIYFIINH